MIKEIFGTFSIAAKIWLIASGLLAAGTLVVMTVNGMGADSLLALLIFPFGLIATIPVLVLLMLSIYFFSRRRWPLQQKAAAVAAVAVVSCLLYGSASPLLTQAWGPFDSSAFLKDLLLYNGALILCVLPAWYFTYKQQINYFIAHTNKLKHHQTKIMETSNYPDSASGSQPKPNSILSRAIITGCLILVMMIPTFFISNLVNEREERQKNVVAEVSAKWAGAQTLSGPFLYIPYKIKTTAKDGKIEESVMHYWLLPEDLKVNGTVNHLIRPRSIYKVLLYRSVVETEGRFTLKLPSDILPETVIWKDVKLCYGLSDFKGIEERLSVNLNNTPIELTPGLPEDDIAENGLSANINLSDIDIDKDLNFNLQLKLKGSEVLHFIPLSGNSSYVLQSDWRSPSFDGNNLPAEREVGDSGFTAKWTFNKANLPFGTLLREVKFDPQTLAFGATLLEPADQYAKTNRSIKYAILFIGLTFSLFFIVELMQKKPMHPVQYTLIGLALVIFYTLLLSVSEFVVFDLSYLIASAATISLVTWYAGAHFKAWKPALILFAALFILYAFIFVLIRLEDTALLIGSVGLFIILAIAMYFSKRINWYGTNQQKEALPVEYATP
jgi:inner membrane protein